MSSLKNLSSINPKNWNEKNLERKVIKKLVSLGYSHFQGKDIKRSGAKEVIIYEDLKKYLSSKFVSNSDIEKIIQKLIEDLSNKTNDDFCLFRKYFCEGIEFNQKIIYLIDFENLENNQFKVINQLNIFGSGNKKRIPDILVYINGFPLVLFELKAPKIAEEIKIHKAVLQVIKNYRNNIPQLFKYVHLTIFSNQWNTLLLANGEHLSKKAYQLSNLTTFIKNLFNKKELLIYLRDYLLDIRIDILEETIQARAFISPDQKKECERIIRRLISCASRKKQNFLIKTKIFVPYLSSWDCVSPMIIAKKIKNIENLKDFVIIYLFSKKKTKQKIIYCLRLNWAFQICLKECCEGLVSWNENSEEQLKKGKIYIVDIEEYFKFPIINQASREEILIMCNREELNSSFCEERKAHLNHYLKNKKFKTSLKKYFPRTSCLLFVNCPKRLISFKWIAWIIKQVLFWPLLQFSKIVGILWNIYWNGLKWLCS